MTICKGTLSFLQIKCHCRVYKVSDQVPLPGVVAKHKMSSMIFGVAFCLLVSFCLVLFCFGMILLCLAGFLLVRFDIALLHFYVGPGDNSSHRAWLHDRLSLVNSPSRFQNLNPLQGFNPWLEAIPEAHVYHTLSRSKEKQTLQIWKKQKEQKLKRLKCEIIFQHHTYWAFKMYPVHQQHQPPERRSPGFKPTEEIDAQEGEPSGLCFTNNPNILWPRICGLSHSKTKADITQMLPWIENPRACIFPYSRFSPFVMPLPLF